MSSCRGHDKRGVSKRADMDVMIPKSKEFDIFMFFFTDNNSMSPRNPNHDPIEPWSVEDSMEESRNQIMSESEVETRVLIWLPCPH
jgi:hypothetical protein